MIEACKAHKQKKELPARNSAQAQWRVALGPPLVRLLHGALSVCSSQA